MIGNRGSLQRYGLAVLAPAGRAGISCRAGNVPLVMPSPATLRTSGSNLLGRERHRHRRNLWAISSPFHGIGTPCCFPGPDLEMLVTCRSPAPISFLRWRSAFIIVWFSCGIKPNMMMAFAICFFPIVLTTARGLREVEPDLLDLVRTLKGSRWQIFTKIQLPGALPYIFAGMKVAAILAVAGAIVGEFLGSDRGLGYLMLQVQVTLDTAAMFMAVILITLLGMALYGMVLGLERLLVVRDARIS